MSFIFPKLKPSIYLLMSLALTSLVLILVGCGKKGGGGNDDDDDRYRSYSCGNGYYRTVYGCLPRGRCDKGEVEYYGDCVPVRGGYSRGYKVYSGNFDIKNRDRIDPRCNYQFFYDIFQGRYDSCDLAFQRARIILELGSSSNSRAYATLQFSGAGYQTYMGALQFTGYATVTNTSVLFDGFNPYFGTLTIESPSKGLSSAYLQVKVSLSNGDDFEIASGRMIRN